MVYNLLSPGQMGSLSMEPDLDGEEGEGEEKDEGEESDHITQRLLNIMASFLEGEVRESEN